MCVKLIISSPGRPRREDKVVLVHHIYVLTQHLSIFLITNQFLNVILGAASRSALSASACVCICTLSAKFHRMLLMKPKLTSSAVRFIAQFAPRPGSSDWELEMIWQIDAWFCAPVNIVIGLLKYWEITERDYVHPRVWLIGQNYNTKLSLIKELQSRVFKVSNFWLL